MINRSFSDSRRHYSQRQIQRQRQTRNEALVYDRNNDYPIQELLEWMSDIEFTADAPRPRKKDYEELRDLVLSIQYTHVYEGVFGVALQVFHEVSLKCSSRRQYLTSSEKKMCIEAVSDMFKDIEIENRKLSDNTEWDTLYSCLLRDSKSSKNTTSDYLLSMLRQCRNWVSDNRNDSDEVRFYATDLMDLFNTLDGLVDAVYFRKYDSDFGKPDMMAVLNDSSLRSVFDSFKKPGKATVESLYEMQDSIASVQEKVDREFDYILSELKDAFGNLDENENLSDEEDDVFTKLSDIWEKITDTIEGYPATDLMRIGRSWM